MTLLDTHISAVIGAAVPVPVRHRPDPRVRDDAVHRLASNLFTSTFVSKTLFELALSRRRQVTTLSI